jgi:hypothetical protein
MAAKVEISEDILKKLEDIIKINESLAKANQAQSAEIEKLKADKDGFQIEIGCNLIMGSIISSPNNETQIDIKYNEVLTVTSSDIAAVLKNSKNRELFVKDLVYFVDETNYKFFNIKKKNDLSDKALIAIASNEDSEKLNGILDKLTSKKNDSDVMHTIFYKIVDLNTSGKLKNMTYPAREAIETYFSMKIKFAETLLKTIKDMG